MSLFNFKEMKEKSKMNNRGLGFDSGEKVIAAVLGIIFVVIALVIVFSIVKDATILQTFFNWTVLTPFTGGSTLATVMPYMMLLILLLIVVVFIFILVKRRNK